MPPGREQFAGQRPEAPLHAVADDGATDFLGDGEADAQAIIAVGTIAHQQDETWHRESLAAVGGKEIRPFTENC
jgi:hypothetical protein